MVMTSAGVVDITAPAAGRMAEVPVSPGDMVRVGQTIAVIAQPDLDERIRRAIARVAELENRARQVASLARRGLALNEDVIRQRREFLGQQRSLAEARVRIVTEQNATVTQLLDQGLVTGRAVQEAARELRAAQLAVRDLDRQIADLARGRTEVIKREADERAGVELEIAEARRELAMLKVEQKRSAVVSSPFEGRVIEVKANRGMLVARDASLVSLERDATRSGEVEVVMFVAASDGKKIPPGAETHVIPATVKREEKGHLLGNVRFISDYPATPQSLIATLGNEELVREIANVAAPFEIRVDLRKDSRGYQWSRASADRPPLLPGTLCSGEILVRRERPIGFVIPALRRDTKI